MCDDDDDEHDDNDYDYDYDNTDNDYDNDASFGRRSTSAATSAATSAVGSNYRSAGYSCLQQVPLRHEELCEPELAEEAAEE